MKVQNTEEDTLDNEVSFAKKVESSYTTWLSDYFAKERLKSFNEFCNGGQSLDTDCLNAIHQRQLALDKIENDMLTYIETGKLASISLAKIHEQE